MNSFFRFALTVFAGATVLAAPFSRAQSDQPTGPQTLPSVPLHIGSATLQTEIAFTPRESEIGLMFRSSLPDNSGMIFVLPVGRATFWMKNTLIPLSIAFLDRKGVVLELHDMKAMDTSITASDSDQVAYAIETNLHWFALNGIKPGMKIDPAPDVLFKTAAPSP
jgi:uncharacterized membrane protein (UPF0127 family)